MGMGGIDEPSGLDGASLSGEQRSDDPVVADFAHGEVLDATRGQKTLPHCQVVVAHHLRAGGQHVEACIQTRLIDSTRAERRRIHTVEAGRLMQADVGVSVVPVPPGRSRRSTITNVASDSVSTESAKAIPAAPAPMIR
jgi:hypothetical protein